jgi:DNA-directed RNA polymerase specialized sigma24 family protein
MVRKMYWEGKSTAEVAVETGITQRRCQQILFSALDVMRRHVEA